MIGKTAQSKPGCKVLTVPQLVLVGGAESHKDLQSGNWDRQISIIGAGSPTTLQQPNAAQPVPQSNSMTAPVQFSM